MTLDPAHALDALLDPDHPLKRETAEWARSVFGDDDVVGRDDRCEFSETGWKLCADHGILGLRVPEADGGQGRDLVSALLVLEGLGLGCPDNGLTFAVASQIWAIQGAIVRFGTDDQRHRWLPPMVRGEVLGAFAISEPETGSDSFALATTAERGDDGNYRINGTKAHITMGPRCDVMLVFASTRPDAGRWGLSAFVVPMDTPGVHQHPSRPKMGMRTTPFGNIDFDDVVVPADTLLGHEGSGASIFAKSIESERAYLFATSLGAMERQLQATVEYARHRHAFGQPIGGFQAVSHRVADMKLRHEAARLLLYKAALLEETGRPVTDAAAMAKLAASEAGVASGLDASVVHGAVGYISGEGVERELRDAIGGLVYSGTSDIQRNIIARMLGVG